MTLGSRSYCIIRRTILIHVDGRYRAVGSVVVRGNDFSAKLW